MKTADTITTAIFKKADKEFDALLEKQFGQISTILAPIFYTEQVLKWNGEIKIPTNSIVALLKASLAEQCRATFRENAVKEFIARVEHVGAEVVCLREELDNQ